MHKNGRIEAFLALSLLSTLALPGADTACAGVPVEVVTCGQVVQGNAFLAADLDCSGQNVNDHTVVLSPGATLDLAGFTLTGRTTSVSNDDGYVETVACRGRCTILGPGTIVGAPAGPASVVGFDTWEDGKRIEVVNATITGGNIGVNARRVDLAGATITGNRSVGVWAFQARVDNSTVTENGLAPNSHTRIGVFGQVKSRVRNSVVTGNGMGGVEGWRVSIDDTTATGNNAHGDCATRLCGDLSSRFSMRVLGASTCETSINEGSFDAPGSYINQPLPIAGGVQTWGVCSLD